MADSIANSAVIQHVLAFIDVSVAVWAIPLWFATADSSFRVAVSVPRAFDLHAFGA